MNEKIKEFQVEFICVTEESTMFCFAARGKEFQIEACQKLDALKQKANALKEQMISLQDGDSANSMLSFEKLIEALINELKMWISLKEDNPNAAWDFLARAQSAARIAMQAHDVANDSTSYIEHLHDLERILFPSQIFLSAGMIVDGSTCSICGKEYGECEHIKGKAYMGKICGRRITTIKEFREVSIVEIPSNKHCRLSAVADKDEIERDCLTWRAVTSEKVK